MVSSMKNFVIGAVIAGVFLLCMIMFGANLAFLNNANQTILNDPSLAKLNQSLFGSLNDFQSSSTQQQNASFGQPTTETDEGFTINFLPTIKVFFQMPIIIWNVIGTGAEEIIGIPRLILNLIGAVILITVIFLGWRVLRTGN